MTPERLAEFCKDFQPDPSNWKHYNANAIFVMEMTSRLFQDYCNTLLSPGKFSAQARKDSKIEIEDILPFQENIIRANDSFGALHFAYLDMITEQRYIICENDKKSSMNRDFPFVTLKKDGVDEPESFLDSDLREWLEKFKTTLLGRGSDPANLAPFYTPSKYELHCMPWAMYTLFDALAVRIKGLNDSSNFSKHLVLLCIQMRDKWFEALQNDVPWSDWNS